MLGQVLAGLTVVLMLVGAAFVVSVHPAKMILPFTSLDASVVTN